MMASVFSQFLQYSCYAVEACLVIAVVARAQWRKYPEFALFAVGYASIDAILRPIILFHYGQSSLQYRYCYWFSDAALTLGAFLLISFFFRRALGKRKDLWPLLRSILSSVFILITLISVFSISSHYHHLIGDFIVEFQQNLYFGCLVLNTLLYVMLAQMEKVDEDLNLLVCGLGVQFAGPAAVMALIYLTGIGVHAPAFFELCAQACTLATWLTWFYTLTRNPREEPVSYEEREETSAFAKVSMRRLSEV
jgi:hypothetical protein